MSVPAFNIDEFIKNIRAEMTAARAIGVTVAPVSLDALEILLKERDDLRKSWDSVSSRAAALNENYGVALADLAAARAEVDRLREVAKQFRDDREGWHALYDESEAARNALTKDVNAARADLHSMMCEREGLHARINAVTKERDVAIDQLEVLERLVRDMKKAPGANWSDEIDQAIEKVEEIPDLLPCGCPPSEFGCQGYHGA